MTVTEPSKRQSTAVPLRWDEVYHANCPMASAKKADQETGAAGTGELP
jgi:hypothetical protein